MIFQFNDILNFKFGPRYPTYDPYLALFLLIATTLLKGAAQRHVLYAEILSINRVPASAGT